MTIVFDSNHFNPIIYTKQCCVPSVVANKPSLTTLCEKVPKTIKKKRTLARNFKRITIFFDSNHFDTITSTKQCYAPSFIDNKPSFEPLFAIRCTKLLKKPKKRNLVRKFKHMIIFFDSNHINTIKYTKQLRVRIFMANKPSFNHFLRESSKML